MTSAIFQPVLGIFRRAMFLMFKFVSRFMCSKHLMKKYLKAIQLLAMGHIEQWMDFAYTEIDVTLVVPKTWFCIVYSTCCGKIHGESEGRSSRFDLDRIVMSGGATGTQETLAFCLSDPGDAFNGKESA